MVIYHGDWLLTCGKFYLHWTWKEVTLALVENERDSQPFRLVRYTRKRAYQKMDRVEPNMEKKSNETQHSPKMFQDSPQTPTPHAREQGCPAKGRSSERRGRRPQRRQEVTKSEERIQSSLGRRRRSLLLRLSFPPSSMDGQTNGRTAAKTMKCAREGGYKADHGHRPLLDRGSSTSSSYPGRVSGRRCQAKNAA